MKSVNLSVLLEFDLNGCSGRYKCLHDLTCEYSKEFTVLGEVIGS